MRIANGVEPPRRLALKLEAGEFRRTDFVMTGADQSGLTEKVGAFAFSACVQRQPVRRRSGGWRFG